MDKLILAFFALLGRFDQNYAIFLQKMQIEIEDYYKLQNILMKGRSTSSVYRPSPFAPRL